MKVLQFGFEKEDKGGTNEYLPHNYYTNNCVIYTGTHDNDTVCGWFKSLDKETERKVLEYIINKPDGIYYTYDKCIRKLPDVSQTDGASGGH